MNISDDARFSIHAIRDGVSHDTFINNMWERRDAGYTGPTKSTGAWPHVRVADQRTDARVNVSKFPARLKVQS